MPTSPLEDITIRAIDGDEEAMRGIKRSKRVDRIGVL
jgi:hypothetical protein